MIKVLKRFGEKHLVCTEEHTFGKITVLQGTIGAAVNLPIETEVNYWADHEVNLVAPFVLENSIVLGKATIGPNAVLVNTAIKSEQSDISGSGIFCCASLRNSVLDCVKSIEIRDSTIQRLTVDSADSVRIIKSEIDEVSSSGRNMDIVKSVMFNDVLHTTAKSNVIQKIECHGNAVLYCMSLK